MSIDLERFPWSDSANRTGKNPAGPVWSGLHSYSSLCAIPCTCFLSHALLYILSSSTPLKNFSANPVIFQKQCKIFRSAQWPVYNFSVKLFLDHLSIARRIINVLLFAADQFSYFGSSDGVLHHCPIPFA